MISYFSTDKELAIGDTVPVCLRSKRELLILNKT